MYPDSQAKGSVRITYSELRRLRHPGRVTTPRNLLLNDQLVDYYVQMLLHEKLSLAARKRVHIFNSFFLKRLRLSLRGKHDPELKSIMKWVQAWYPSPTLTNRPTERAMNRRAGHSPDGMHRCISPICPVGYAFPSYRRLDRLTS